ncbi:piggyBac transposable element-derived protein 4-like [Eupeodes corollae]|uniref:piggyBac transposable element-derived protein 4-like n=1 Tax=Eupeodes corollae TaxID=290404 RepID=UPI002492573E|nr:piggyBac transposable element-derived protein 4-like [Eupeodes corollae]
MVIDETVIPWRGRLVFRQYIPNKAHPYGIKLFNLCSTEGFTWSTKIYSGKSSTGVREVGLAKNVCEELSSLLKGEGRTLFVDNFYTSYELARSMLDQKTHVVGTLRANKKFCPKEVMNAQLKRGEMVAREEENGIVVLKWKDTRDVRMLSTKHAPVKAAVSDQSIPDPNIPSTSRGRRINQRQGNREKPLAIIEYNKGKSGIDLSDQMASYATTLRRGLKWYRKVAIEFLLGMAVVNAFLVYKKATKSVMQIRKFREQVAEGLLDLLSPQPVASKKHYIEKRKDSNGKTIRRACVLCYAQKKLTIVGDLWVGRIIADQNDTVNGGSYKAMITDNYVTDS